MKKFLVIIVLILSAATPAMAAELDFSAPTVPDSGQALLPYEPETFWDGLEVIFKEAFPLIQPALSEAAGVCFRLFAIVVLLSITEGFAGTGTIVARLIGAVSIASVLLSVTKSMIPLGQETVRDISNYGKLLLPVMTGALAAQGGAATSSALYAGTAFFDAILSGLIEKLLLPGVYAFLAVAIAACALDEPFLSSIKDMIKGITSWVLKIILYFFTGYMTISGAVSGSADAMAIKAAKVTISGAVPVVGGILSDASEAVLVSAGIMKNAAGVYGVLAVLAVTVGPFIRLGAQYILLKLTSTVCTIFGGKALCTLIHDFAAAMGFILAMTAAVSLMLVISIVCFMRVVG